MTSNITTIGINLIVIYLQYALMLITASLIENAIAN
jgi:hypothetical protein